MTAVEQTPLTAPATADLCRSVPFELVRDDGDPGDGLTFRGYAAVFNEATVIDSWEGKFEEKIAPGAFKKSLRERTPVFQFDHGTHPMVGSIPLGPIKEAREDDKGVYVEARLHDNWLTQPVRDGIASGSINGMSFRFEVMQDRWTDQAGTVLNDPEEIMARIYGPSEGGLLIRTLIQLKSREMGPVVFPAYAGTTAAVRSVTLDLTHLDDPEQRRALAQAVLFADNRERPLDFPQSPEGTPDGAADHGSRDNDPPQATVTAGEHESETTDAETLRDAIKRRRAIHAARLRFALEGAPRYE
jgi:HK97 family phage prohead protease